MSRNSSVQLDSFRYVQFQGGVECYVCGAKAAHTSELCTHCHAPMALGDQVRNHNVEPQMIAALGASGVGKTVYLGMLLDMLARNACQMQMVTRGAFSITLQESVVSSLARCCFPHKTPSEPDRWNWVHCQVTAPRRKRPVELIMPDVAGEALLQEVDHPGTYPVLKSFLKKCSGVVLLVDSMQVGYGGRSQDYFAMKLLSYLLELDPHPKTGWGRRPLAFALSKAETCDACIQDPRGYAQQHLTGLWKQCNEHFRQFEFFASGVVGASAYRDTVSEGRIRVPLRIEPHGIIEPFQWLVEHLPK